MTTKKTDTSGVVMEGNAPDGMALSDKEAKDARHDGAKDAAKESAKDSYIALTDGNLPGEPPEYQYLGSDESQPYAYIIDLGVEAFEKRVASDGDDTITDMQVAGLLKLERAGQNRTPYVKALIDRLGVKGKDIYKVTGAGPAYTNDLSNLSDL